MQVTPAAIRWDETPGHGKGAETPGATPGISTRMWDATPAHATPGAATPGRETPSHEKTVTSRRNRWDETPKTERGIELYYFTINNYKNNCKYNCENIGANFYKFHVIKKFKI